MIATEDSWSWRMVLRMDWMGVMTQFRMKSWVVVPMSRMKFRMLVLWAVIRRRSVVDEKRRRVLGSQ